LPPLLCTGWLFFGLWQLADFQKTERVWRRALDRSLVLALINFGLSPFLFWWNRIPDNTFFLAMVVLLALSGLVFLASLNIVLRRLGAILPDEGLHHETRQFTTLNLNLLLAMMVLGILLLFLHELRHENLPLWVHSVRLLIERSSLFLLVPLVLLPLAMTMALVWKTKEVILESVFSRGN
jgi:hypothetical protein